MRMIKFRAWDNVNKRYYEVGCLDWRKKNGVQVILYRGYTNEVLEDCVLEQFTGLLDKNGNEIYEGDILQRGKCKKIVGFVAEAAGFKMYNVVDKPHEEEWDIWQTMSQSWVDEFGAEIVGNIHQS